MSAKLQLKCGCGVRLRISAKHSGKQAKCKGCGNKFTVPTVKGPTESSLPSDGKPKFDPTRSAAAAAANAAMKPIDAARLKSKSSSKEPCSSCGAKIQAGAAVCIYCGYHLSLIHI